MSTITEYFESLKGESIAVIGMGVSNTPLIKMMLRAGLKVTVCDKSERERVEEQVAELESLGAKFQLGEDYLRKLYKFDVIFRTPGLSPNNPALVEAAQRGSRITSEMELFFELCPCRMIAVTGSDGKTTTTTLISEFLKEAGFNVYVGGNIGKPLLPDVAGMVPEDMVVLAISVVTFRDQYMADGSMSVDPDSMYIYGEPYILDGVDKVYTRTISQADVSEDVSGMIGLEKIKGVRFSVDQVRYQMNVKRYVELELNLPVRTVNVPQGAILRVYPSDARVRLRCSFPLIEDPEKGLFLVADYNDYVKSRNGKCTLKLSGLSRGIIGYQIEPVSVSGLIEGIH